MNVDPQEFPTRFEPVWGRRESLLRAFGLVSFPLAAGLVTLGTHGHTDTMGPPAFGYALMLSVGCFLPIVGVICLSTWWGWRDLQVRRFIAAVQQTHFVIDYDWVVGRALGFQRRTHVRDDEEPLWMRFPRAEFGKGWGYHKPLPSYDIFPGGELETTDFGLIERVADRTGSR